MTQRKRPERILLHPTEAAARRSHQLFPNDAAVANIGDDLSVFAGKKDRKSTRLNSSHIPLSRMPSSA